MAVVTRRYRYITVTDANLQAYVAPSAAGVAQYVNSVDIQIDTAVVDNDTTLDQYMASLGYVYDPVVPASLATYAGLESWWWNRTAAAGFNSIMDIGPSTAYQSIIMPRAGYFYAATSYSRLTITAGVMTFQLKKGTASGATSDIVGATWTMDNVSFPRARTFVFPANTYTFAQGDKIEIGMVGGGTLAPANDWSVTLEAMFT